LSPREWAVLCKQGWLVLDGREAFVAGGLGPASYLTALGHALSETAHFAPDSVGPVTLVREVANSPYATLRAGPVAFHNDGVYLYHPPRYLMLLCETPADTGGETLLVRGIEVLAALQPDLRQRMRATLLRAGTGNYRALRQWVGAHPDHGDEVLYFFDPSLADDACIEDADGHSMPEIIAGVRGALDRTPVHHHVWTRGDVLVIDNLRILHGRASYCGERLLHRLIVGPYAGRAAAR
jgi:alpha-ketoglutarate-dependent taurine dioxygenase